METTHVLVVSDDAEMVDDITGLLQTAPGTRRRYHVESMNDFSEVLRALVRNSHDVFILDQIIPGSNVGALDLVQRAIAGGCTMPILVVTTMADEDIEWAADDAGAAGFLNRNLDLHERTLKHALRYATGHFRQLQEMQELLGGVQKQLAEVERKLRR